MNWSVACALADSTGHDLSLKLYPVRSVSLRDSGQLGEIRSLLEEAHASWHRRLEVPVAPGDPRAADLLLIGRDEVLHIEVERTLVDIQAQLRAAQRKRSTLAETLDRPVRLVMAVPGTRRNRAAVADIAPILRAALPASSPRVWRAIRTGQKLGADGLLFLSRVPMTSGRKND